MSDGWGYLTRPHDPTRQNAALLKAEVGSTEAGAGDSEPGSKRKGKKSICWGESHARPNLGYPGRLGEQILPETRACFKKET